MKKERFEKQELAATKLSEYLAGKLDRKVGYPDLPTWGYAFSALFFNGFSDKKEMAELSIKLLSMQHHENKEYSWEFVTFAIKLLSNRGEVKIPENFLQYREKGTRMFNWFLLRCHNKLVYDKENKFVWVKLRIALVLYQTKEGLILDEFKTRSLHYHAFCLFVIAHILKENKSDWLKECFVKGVEFALKYIMDDGTSLFIGRGQEQIFGYGSLLYSLEYCNKEIKKIDENLLEKVSSKILNNQRCDGSFPLVLRVSNPEPENVNYRQDKPCGWHGYNTLYDYLPFLGYCLSETSKLK
ncbi:TPA: hypothetical protein ACGF8R_003258 [Vibrio cholerae]